MGNCCKFIKRSTRYRNDEKIDQSGGSGSGYRQKYSNQANTNPIAYTSDISLNKSNKYKFNSHNHINSSVIVNSAHTVSINARSDIYEPSASYENKSEDGNLSIPHIADFYPEDNNTVPADNPRTSTLFLPKASIDKRKKNERNYLI